MKIDIKWLQRAQVPAVLAIELQSFELPWDEEDFIRCMRHRNCIGMVALHRNQVRGYMFYELFRCGLHLLNFAVDPAVRRAGVGRAMIAKLQGKLSLERRNRITVDVRETNLDAQLFLKRLGFRAVAVTSGIYDDSDEDAYVFQYRYHAAAEEIADPNNRLLRYTHPQESE